MKNQHITRRQFFKLSAFGAGTVAASSLVGIVGPPPEHAVVQTRQPQLAIPQPTFNPIASTTAFGAPTDLSAGWDGTLWAIDASGAPHLYDPTTDAWLPYGKAIDAAAWAGTTFYWFCGDEVTTAPFGGNATAPQPITAVFPKLPDSFKLSVNGAANVNGTLILFNGGRYAPADGSAPPIALTSLTDWPQTPAWVDGVIDAVHSDGTSTVLLFAGAEFVTANLQTKAIATNPAPIGSYAPWQNRIPAAWAVTGFDAAFTQGNETAIYKGTAIAVFTASTIAPATPQYLPAYYPTWPAVWHPRLQHAPSGRMGNLWCATTAQGIVQHDGENWNAIAGRSASVAVGQDNSVYVVSGDNQTIDTLVPGTGWVATATAPVQLTKVAVGDADHVFVLGNDGSVHRLIRSSGAYSYNQIALGAGVPNPTHMAANADGTLWHCNSANANAQRFISEASASSATIPVKNGVVTGVQKVASTGFGAAHCLVTQTGQSQPQVYRYDSPYVFKTSKAYEVAGSSTSSFAQGLGNLYFVQVVSNPMPNELYVRFVAIDQHTGQEVASYTPPGYSSQYTGMVFDPVNELVYVASAPVDGYTDNNTPGTLYALDARTLAVKWTSSTYRGIDATPALSNGLLCFGDRIAQLYCIDTQAALAAAAQNKPIPNKWVFPIDTNGPVNRVSTPLFNGNQVIAMTWALEYDPGEGLVLYTTESVDVRDGSGNNFGLGLPLGTVPQNVINEFLVLQPPLVKPLLFPGYSAPSQAIIVRAVNSLIAWNLESQDFSQLQFNLPGGAIASSLTYDDGTRTGSGLSNSGNAAANARLWFGDDQGNLWSLDRQFRAVDGTPYQVQRNTQVFTAPVLYKDPQGGLTVLFGIYDPNNFTLPPSLYGYDPDNGNHASVPTGVTQITTLSPAVTNGVVYAGGWGAGVTQVFGIRVDELPQTLRDFVIESQMMQDPDPSSPNGDPSNNVPPSVARYQTHLTVVDDQKTPLARESVKIWCDTPNTKITVDGQPFTVGPADASFASVHTGTDGSLVILMDATDYFAPTLRAWASFMDPYERIVVNPDAEFHRRVMTAHANASDDDPDKVNLQTATNYKGASLFTADEKSQNPSQPQNVANSIQQANKGLGLSKANSKGLYRKMMRAMGVKHKNQRINVQFIGPSTSSGAPPPDKYMAYADLPGATHFPTNIPSSRLASIVQPVGLSFSRPNGDCKQSPAFSAISHADARAAIDALQGTPWQPSDSHSSNPGQCVPPRVDASSGIGPQRAFNIFQDFWNWLKGLIDKITQCILSIAEDILAGIQYIVNGILKVFKAIIKVLEDVFPFLGSFFKMLEKLIDDVVAALSVLFHFGEIIKTHKWLRDQINANLQQVAGAMQTQVKPAVDGFFNQGEKAIEDLFSSIRQQLGINDDTPINGVNSARSTPHTAFTAGPGAVGPNSGGGSHAVQCTHTTQKMKNGLPGATSQSDNPISGNDDDMLSGFITNFVNSLQTNPAISTAFNELQTAISKISHPQSAGDFFKAALNLLLTIVEDLILGMVAVTQALVDGLIGAIQALVSTTLSLLNTPVDIPFLSWLYSTVFGEPLTILNAVSLVAAIPVTIIYRVVEGHYPSQDGITGTAAAGVDAAQPQYATAVTPDVLKKMQGLIGGTIALGLGVARGVVDAAGPNPPRIGTIFVLTFGVLYISTYFPLMIPGPAPSGLAWAAWGLGMCLALLGTFGVINLKKAEQETQAIFKGVLTFLRVGLGVARLIVFIVAFVQGGNRNAVTDVQFARSLFLELPPMFNWLKLLPEPANIVLTVIDALTGIVVCALDITAAFLDSARAPRRYYFPFVPVQR